MNPLRPEMELRWLWYFVAVAEHLHFGKAAEELGIEQSPLSQQIRRLEDALGCQLFERTSRRVRLTAAGTALLPEAQRLLAQSRGALEAVRSVSQGRTGLLAVGFAASTLFTPVSRIISAYRTRFPNVELRLRELSTAMQVEELRTGAISVGFLREPLPRPWLVTEEVVREAFVAVLPGRHPLARHPELNLNDLADEPFVLFPQHVAPALFGQVQQLFGSAGFYPRIIQEALEWTTIVALVQAGLGVSVVPASFHTLRLGNVAYVPLAAPRLHTRIAACYPTGSQSALLQGFLGLMREVVAGAVVAA
jgi:DNA-binding transcriptional LysR family regulator